MTDLQALSDAATPGPWKFSGRDVDEEAKPGIGERSGLGYEIEGPPEAWHRGQFALRADAAYIVALVNWHRNVLAASPSPDTDVGLDVQTQRLRRPGVPGLWCPGCGARVDPIPDEDGAL